MALINHRPHRAAIRFKAKMQLLETTDEFFGTDDCFESANPLLEELAATLFQSRQYLVFYEQHHSKQEAKQAEDRLAQELAGIYLQVMRHRQNPVVQSLNALL
ncbi:MAG: hypothetical protein KME15_04825 [Drouetiella hepatica Uher 2000/2452]|uniref:Uncharacterized protein n=1 Tax=Drouetiella hepatica Uher 2000/2452 TaxID=904376 RepID=A0A951QA05_9CYAN|nr:hypothetical protein [Drouetiella hepatica Uher 2000/2452]